MRQTAISFGILMSTCLGAAGCVSAPLIDMAEKKETRRNLVFDVSSAYRDADGAIHICAEGLPAKRARSLPPVSYGITVPTRLHGPEPETDYEFLGSAEPIRSYVLPEESISGTCAEEAGDIEDIPVQRVSADELDAVGPRSVPPERLLSFVDETEPGPKLYVFQDAGPGMPAWVVYRHDTADFDGSRLVRIETPPQTVRPQSGALVLLPITFAIDVVLTAVMLLGLALGGA